MLVFSAEDNLADIMSKHCFPVSELWNREFFLPWPTPDVRNPMASTGCPIILKLRAAFGGAVPASGKLPARVACGVASSRGLLPARVSGTLCLAGNIWLPDRR